MRPLVLAAALFPLAVAAQSMGYADADSPSEAVGMMKSSIVIAAKMKELCGSRYPALVEEMETNLRKWRTKERSVVAKAEFYWTEMVKKQPKIEEMLALAESAVAKNFEIMQSAPGDEVGRVGAQYCKQHFADLASGIWRSRTPRAYTYLDRAP